MYVCVRQRQGRQLFFRGYVIRNCLSSFAQELLLATYVLSKTAVFRQDKKYAAETTVSKLEQYILYLEKRTLFRLFSARPRRVPFPHCSVYRTFSTQMCHIPMGTILAYRKTSTDGKGQMPIDMRTCGSRSTCGTLTGRSTLHCIVKRH